MSVIVTSDREPRNLVNTQMVKIEKRKQQKKTTQNWCLEIFGCQQQQHANSRTDVLSGGFIIVKAAACLSVSSLRLCCLCTTCDCVQRPVLLRSQNTEGKIHKLTPESKKEEKKLHSCAGRPPFLTLSFPCYLLDTLLHSLFFVHIHTNDSQMLPFPPPPSAAPPTAAGKLLSSYCSPFCRKWST